MLKSHRVTRVRSLFFNCIFSEYRKTENRSFCLFPSSDQTPQKQEPEQSENHRRKKRASFFLESDEEMENENHQLQVEAIVADEIEKYQIPGIDDGFLRLMAPTTVL